ncbi:DNA-3-methyladenine glycosylase I [Kribbella sandramycini]|uniref:DNA-3-methyladenine glycosylase I n=1 Tax=Kribbella sandramycini TaxID=60450 RepID=A0A7Y4P0K1_9ACTN|nr:DNA-3-methyladenine glycosylase I [Kribbella sandramycini]MBB6571366.1 DNA-3-methyladenine glycosylase I [Kribbella sandramycini]NOL43232.1 DNA-3-methyladenine glycosylase I [Kribbella sandramycini]
MTVIGADGQPRCGWATSAPEYVEYHDNEWGKEIRDDRALFERMTLEGFQSGLSWITILRKRENFRTAFAQFDPEQIAKYGDADFDRLMADAGIVRNRLKINATIANARALLELADGEFTDLLWSFQPAKRKAPKTLGDVPATTPESVAMSKALKKHGFVFVGPTTAYALMQATGIVNDHLATCIAR